MQRIWDGLWFCICWPALVASPSRRALPQLLLRDQISEVSLELLPGAQREVTAKELAAQWRELAGDIPGIGN